MNCETLHYDNARTGWLSRTASGHIAPATTRPWGKYLELDLGSPVRGAAMFLENWTLIEGQHAHETHTMVYFATSANELYAYSEEQLRTGVTAPIWQTSLGPADHRDSSNIPPPVGVCGTVVLDSANRRLFAVALVDEGRTGSVYHIYAVNLDSGRILANQALIDPGANSRPTFIGRDHDQRGALLLTNGWVYAIFADFEADDRGPYRGWLVGCRADNLADQQYLCAAKRVLGGGIWGPGGASADAANNIYCVTGNATTADDDYWDGFSGGSHPGDFGDFFEAVFRAAPSLTVNASRWDNPVEIPGWFGNESQGGGIAIRDLNLDGKPDLVIFHIDHPSGGNHGYYRIGWGVDAAGNVATWGSPVQIPGWFGNDNQGGAIAIADLNGDGIPELIVFHIDHPSGGNHGYYRIGWGLNSSGTVASWSAPVQIPGWFGNESSGAGIAIADLNGDGVPELIVFHIDNPSGDNHGYYRIGWGLNSTGKVSGPWSAPTEIAGWWGAENEGGGIAVADLDADGRPEFIVFHIDHPSGGNHGYYRIGRNVDMAGAVSGGWSDPVQVPGWFGNDNQAGSIAVADLDKNGALEFVVFHIDDPRGANHGYYRIGWNIVTHTALSAIDWYLPTGARPLNDDDKDLGGASALLLPLKANSGGPLLVTGDKAGNVYLLDSLNLGKWGNEVAKIHVFDPASGEARCAPAYYRTPQGKHLIYVSAHGNPGLIAFRLDNADSPSPGLAVEWRAHSASGQVVEFDNAAGSPLVVSTPGTGREQQEYAMVWVLDGGDHGRTLHAFDALSGAEIFNSDWIPGDALEPVPHYPPMNCTENSVFVGTNKGLACFRLPRIQAVSQTQFVAVHDDHPHGGDHGYYRIGWDVNNGGTPLYWDPPIGVPGWFGNENQACSIAAADLNGDARPELVVFHIDHPSGGNHGYYRVGWNVNVFGQPSLWTSPVQIPGWFGNENQGGGIAVTDLNSDGIPELIVFHIDHPSGGNHGYYRIGWGLNSSGNINGPWSAPVQIPGWFGNENQGGGIAVADLNSDGIPELIVFHIDHPSGGNHGYYRIGWDLGPTGAVSHWSDPVQIPGWFGNENQGGGIAVQDLDGDGIPELIVLHIDHPSGGNHGYYRIGWDLSSAGVVSHWSDPVQIPGWFGNENQGGGITLLNSEWSWIWEPVPPTGQKGGGNGRGRNQRPIRHERTEAAEAIVRRLIDELNGGNLAALDELLAPGYGCACG